MEFWNDFKEFIWNFFISWYVLPDYFAVLIGTVKWFLPDSGFSKRIDKLLNTKIRKIVFIGLIFLGTLTSCFFVFHKTKNEIRAIQKEFEDYKKQNSSIANQMSAGINTEPGAKDAQVFDNEITGYLKGVNIGGVSSAAFGNKIKIQENK